VQGRGAPGRLVRLLFAGAVVALLIVPILPVATAAAQVPVAGPGQQEPAPLTRLGAPATPGVERYLVVLRPPSVLERLGSLARTGRGIDLTVRAAGAIEAAAGRPQRDLTRLMGAFSADLDAEALARLQADPRVTEIIPNVAVVASDRRVATTQALPLTGLLTPEYLWNLDRLQTMDDRRYRYTSIGTGVDIYVLDTGIRFVHNDFLDAAGSTRILPASTFVGGHYDVTYLYYTFPAGSIFAPGVLQPAQDCNLHGAHVAGTAAGRFSGVAKGASIIPVKVFPECELITHYIEDILDGMQWVLVNRRQGVPAVVNMSLGAGPLAPGTDAALDLAVDALVNAGITVIAAAGNRNDDACRYWPARVPSAITVGATAADDTRSWFSNHGSCVDVFAPGSDIDSSCAIIKVNADGTRPSPVGGLFVYREDCTTGATIRIDGTSMAAPLVAGLAARHLERVPDATPAEVRAAILGGALSGAAGGTALIGDRKTGSPDLLVSSLFLEPAGPSSSDPAPIPVVVACSGSVESARLQQLPQTGVAPLSWSVISGTLPGDLSLSPLGRLTGSGSALFGSASIGIVDAFGRSAAWTVAQSSLPVGCVPG